MKKVVASLMLSGLMLTCATSVFADFPKIIFEGKTIGPTDTRTSLIKKFGKPTSGDKTYSYWDKPNFSMSASYDQYGVKEFGIAQLKSVPSNVQLKVNEQTITLGKDTINSAIKKFKYGCFDILDTKFNSNYSLSIAAGEEGEMNVVMDAEYTGKKSTSANKPIFGFKFNTNEPDKSEGCNY